MSLHQYMPCIHWKFIQTSRRCTHIHNTLKQTHTVTHMRTNTCAHMHTYMYTYIHTYIHTHTPVITKSRGITPPLPLPLPLHHHLQGKVLQSSRDFSVLFCWDTSSDTEICNKYKPQNNDFCFSECNDFTRKELGEGSGGTQGWVLIKRWCMS